MKTSEEMLAQANKINLQKWTVFIDSESGVYNTFEFISDDIVVYHREYPGSEKYCESSWQEVANVYNHNIGRSPEINSIWKFNEET